MPHLATTTVITMLTARTSWDGDFHVTVSPALQATVCNARISMNARPSRTIAEAVQFASTPSVDFDVNALRGTTRLGINVSISTSVVWACTNVLLWGICTDVPGGYTCKCRRGYTLTGTPGSFACQNKNECRSGEYTCPKNSDCQDSVGSYQCACHAGFRAEGGVCNSIDECAEGLRKCQANATCVDLPGSSLCSCNSGYHGNGSDCFWWGQKTKIHSYLIGAFAKQELSRPPAWFHAFTVFRWSPQDYDSMKPQ